MLVKKCSNAGFTPKEKKKTSNKLIKQLSFIMIFLRMYLSKCPPDTATSMCNRHSKFTCLNRTLDFPCLSKVFLSFFVCLFHNLPSVSRQNSRSQPCYHAFLDLHIQTNNKSY